jgi:MFS family permease
VGTILPAVLGGPLVDRLGFRRVSVLADVLSGAVVATVPLLHHAGMLRFGLLPVLLFLASSLNANGDTARYALMPALLRRAMMTTERVNGADRAIARLGDLSGLLLAGFLITVMGPANVLLVDTGTFLVSATLVGIGVSAAASRAAQVGGERKAGYVSELLEGLRFVRTDTLILSMLLLFMVTNFLDVPLIQVLLPVYARTYYGSATSPGAILAPFAGGAIVGTLLFGLIDRRLPRRLTFLACYVTAPLLVYAALAATPPLAVVAAAGAFGGLIAGPINPLYETVIQEHTPAPLLGRVLGSANALAQAGIPFGAVLVGVVVEGAGLTPTILGMGVLYLAVTVGMVFNPALCRMNVVREA